MNNMFEGKTILVTGGAGSIGSVIVKHLLSLNPKVVRVFDNSEYSLYCLEREIGGPKVRFLIGDIRDKGRVRRAMENVDIVFHAAALKHVPLCEYNPFEALKTNAIGTQNVIDSAIEADVERVINISTDKAVRPANVMGASKLVSEKLITSANYYKGSKRIVFSSVRFGNVLESSGSVIPLFKEQAMRGGPITVTDPTMTRFMMSKDQSVDLILKAAAKSIGGEIFILKMDSVNIMDLAEAVIENTVNPGNVKIEIRGVREGEKIHEELMTEEEAKRALETDDMFIILPENKELIERIDYSFEDAKKVTVDKYTSENMNVLPKEDIKKFL